MKKLFFAAFAIIALAAFTLKPYGGLNQNQSVKSQLQSGTPLSATLLGSNEVPGPGDPDGVGFAELTLNQGQGTITYSIQVTGISAPTAAHIHEAGAGVAGPVIIPLSAPVNGVSSGVVTLSKEDIKSIRMNPELYYVNVHNMDYPGGALRGQLSK